MPYNQPFTKDYSLLPKKILQFFQCYINFEKATKYPNSAYYYSVKNV